MGSTNFMNGCEAVADGGGEVQPEMMMIAARAAMIICFIYGSVMFSFTTSVMLVLLVSEIAIQSGPVGFGSNGRV